MKSTAKLGVTVSLLPTELMTSKPAHVLKLLLQNPRGFRPVIEDDFCVVDFPFVSFFSSRE